MEWFLLFLKIMMINIVLSGDNAVVIALASKNLPYHQRKLAVWWGAFAAVGLRVLLTIGAVYVLQVPFIQSAGSLLLLWIAIKLAETRRTIQILSRHPRWPAPYGPLWWLTL
jgi:predicted tellurium resistance membrane protein TerC